MGRLCILLTSSDKTCKAIVKAMETRLPGQRIDVCASTASLALKLAERRGDATMVVLMPEDEEELIEMYSMKRLLDTFFLLLVLPNRDRIVEAIGHRLRPRLICYRHTGATEVASQLLNAMQGCGMHQ